MPFIAVSGPYPRNPNFAKVVSRFQSGKVDKKGFDEAVKKEIERYVRVMLGNKVDYLTAGLMRFDDVVDAMVSLLKNVDKNGLVRFYDNNFYYRVPVVKGKIEFSGGEDYQKDLEAAKKAISGKAKLKVTVLGPLSFATLSEDKNYGDSKALMLDYASAINDFLKQAKGLYDAVEVIEPSFFQKGIGKNEISNAKEAYEKLITGANTEVHLISYFFLRVDRLQDFVGLKADYYGFDLAEERKKKVAFVYRAVKGKGVYLGLLDTRNTKLERVSSLRRFVKGAEEAGAKGVIVGNSSLLDLIPEVIIQRKFSIASKLKG